MKKFILIDDFLIAIDAIQDIVPPKDSDTNKCRIYFKGNGTYVTIPPAQYIKVKNALKKYIINIS